MKTVLVTGASGFIGKYVVSEFIKKGYQVHAIVNTTFLEEQPNLFQYSVNLLDYDSVLNFFKDKHFEGLVHLAWYVGPKCHSTNLNIDWTIASLQLIKAFIENGGKIFFGAGSVSEYDYSYGYLKENTILNSPSIYGQCKASLYNMTQAYCKSNDIIFKWGRIFNLYGPGEKKSRLMPAVINSALINEDVKVSDCLKFQDYLHVLDTARAIVAIYESSVTGAVNICSGQAVKLRYIVEKIVELIGSDSKILWGAVPSSFDDPFVVGSNEKLIKETGWSPVFSLEKGLEDTIDWWRNKNV